LLNEMRIQWAIVDCEDEVCIEGSLHTGKAQIDNVLDLQS
jgi:hypothetical protein